MKNLVYSLLFLLCISSCDPCPDCGQPLLSEPTVELVFINQDSIGAIDDSLRVFEFNDSALAANIDSLTVLGDSLQLILDSIANGGNLDLEQLQLGALIQQRRSDSSLYATFNEDADSLTVVLTTAKSTINAGTLKVETFVVIETGLSINFSDSMSSWNLPLLYEGTSTSYDFSIEDESFSIGIEYETFTEISQEREVFIRAQNIQVVETMGFDSLINCQENCIDGNATFTFYF